MQKESKTLEYKECVNKTYLKTVCAYANYNDGVIIFGITDDLKVVGISNPIDECLNIENQINDSIKPRPNYALKINDDQTISLFVKKGLETPYRYNGKCYTRNDPSTIEVDSLGEKRLVLEGMNLNFEELKSKEQDLSFEIIGKRIIETLGLKEFNNDILISLNLYSNKNGYNNAGALLADTNKFSGIDVVIFGANFNEFKKRYTIKGISLISQYEKALEIFKNEYIIERIEDGFRKKIELIPLNAYREALANAIIHRTYDINADSKIEMYQDKIIITSPGGLLPEISKDDFFKGSYSYLRNPIVANVFHRLEIVEIFATGIRRINEAYKDSLAKPIFDITNKAVRVILPLIDYSNLTTKELKGLNSMKKNYHYNRNDLENSSGFKKDTLIRILNALCEKELVYKTGKTKNTYYEKK